MPYTIYRNYSTKTKKIQQNTDNNIAQREIAAAGIKIPRRRRAADSRFAYFFIAATCLATSSERSSLFFSRPSPIS